MAIFFAMLAAVSFGVLPLLVRRGLRLAPEKAIAAFVQNGVALVLSAIVPGALPAARHPRRGAGRGPEAPRAARRFGSPDAELAPARQERERDEPERRE